MVDTRIERLIPAETIAGRVRELATQIESDFATRSPLFVVVLLGAFVFASDLLRQMSIPAEMTSVVMSSYPDGTERARRTRLLADLRADVAGRDVVILEDIVDTGRTVQTLWRRLEARGASSVTLTALLDKPAGRQVHVPIRYTGFEIPNAFVVGYGLDWNGLYRNLPYVGVLAASRD
jgi:hypoxanthine phosphoribosyltransferase